MIVRTMLSPCEIAFGLSYNVLGGWVAYTSSLLRNGFANIAHTTADVSVSVKEKIGPESCVGGVRANIIFRNLSPDCSK